MERFLKPNAKTALFQAVLKFCAANELFKCRRKFVTGNETQAEEFSSERRANRKPGE